MPETVNVVASGKLGREIDVSSVGEDIDAIVSYPEKDYTNDVVYLRRDEGSPMVTLFRSGSYHITGGNSLDETERMKDWMVDVLGELGIETSPTFAIKNIVQTADLGREVNLNALTIGLGLEQTEYEPEQFPGVVYRPPDIDCVFLVFGSGKVVIPGASDVETGAEGFELLKSRIEDLLG